eukprot:2404535-Pyramimonas_sp.AAC.1
MEVAGGEAMTQTLAEASQSLERPNEHQSYPIMQHSCNSEDLIPCAQPSRSRSRSPPDGAREDLEVSESQFKKGEEAEIAAANVIEVSDSAQDAADPTDDSDDMQLSKVMAKSKAEAERIAMDAGRDEAALAEGLRASQEDARRKGIRSPSPERPLGQAPGRASTD